MIEHDMPPQLIDALKQLWSIEARIIVHIRPRDAFTALGIIQFALRNPAISPTQRQLIEAFGRELQRARGN